MSHYVNGYSDYTHRGVVLRSSVGNTEADDYIAQLELSNYRSGFVPSEYHNRPDLISTVFYRSPYDIWRLCLISNKFDVFEDFRVGSRIAIE